MSGRAKTLLGLIEKHGWTLGAELGVYEGATFDYLLSHCPKLALYGVDTWERFPGGPKDKETGEASYADKPMEQAKQKVRAIAAKHGWRALILKQRTVAAAAMIPDGSLDFVFVDADHRTQAVIGDITAWRPKLKAGGALIGHDEDWPSVRKALHALNMNWQPLPGNVWFSPLYTR